MSDAQLAQLKNELLAHAQVVAGQENAPFITMGFPEGHLLKVNLGAVIKKLTTPDVVRIFDYVRDELQRRGAISRRA